MLQSRDWSVIQVTAGVSDGDLVITSPDGKTFLCEVKNTVSITTLHREQAMRQAKARKLPWMLMSHIAGTSAWLVQRQGCKPTVWGGE